MISIQKNNPGPRSLIEHAARGGHYDQGSNFSTIKQTIREALCEEQGFICCYCMKRIEPTPNKMQIAHIKSQSSHPDLDCSYSNMMGSCPCNETCNQKQEDRDLKLNPTDLSHPVENYIRYEADGTIVSDDNEIDKEINDYLNLNSKAQLLKRNREEIIKRVLKDLNAVQRNKRIKKAQDLLAFWSAFDGGERREYCGAAIWLLKKKLHKWTGNNV